MRVMTERYFYEGTISKKIALEKEEFHHLVKVMRGRIGGEVEIVNGKGYLAQAIIREIKKRKAELEILNLKKFPEEKYDLILCQAIPKFFRLEYILEKGTELGMTEIWLFPGDLSEKKTFSEQQKKRIRSICISAMKQCKRLYLPKIKLLNRLEESFKKDYDYFFGDLDRDAPPLIDRISHNDQIIICIGPEKGFSEKEIILLRNNATGVQLHTNILRTDTAAISALNTIIPHLSQPL